MRRISLLVGLVLVTLSTACDQALDPTTVALDRVDARLASQSGQAQIGVNVLLDRPVTDDILADLGAYGTVTGQIARIDAVFMRAARSELTAIRRLPYVEAAGPDAERTVGPPRPPVQLEDFSGGLSTWNLDAVNVTAAPGPLQRAVAQDGEGVYVGVLDTGLLDSWRYYFPEERIAVEYARSYNGGGAMDGGSVSEQPDKWQHDTHSHGTHVTSTILGYSLGGTPINGVAPRATVVPVKVLNNSGGGWSSVIAQGIVHMTQLKRGPLADHPVIINMSLGGPVLDPVEKAAIDYAVDHGVILVASAGNAGDEGMGYPGAYPPVISVGATGWSQEWTVGPWWFALDVYDPTDPEQVYVTSFSSRAKPGQDLDVLAPGSWVVGPFQLDMGHTSYFFLGGTSMASPHVAGIVALMAQQDPSISAPKAEEVLEATALPIPAGTMTVLLPDGTAEELTWGDDATGSGLVQADAVLGGGSGGAGRKGKKGK